MVIARARRGKFLQAKIYTEGVEYTLYNYDVYG